MIYFRGRNDSLSAIHMMKEILSKLNFGIVKLHYVKIDQV